MGSDRRHIRKCILIIAAVFFAGLVLMGRGAFEGVERKSVDRRLHLWRHARAPEAPIALILIDDASLDAMASLAGRWPWPRGVHGQLIDFLALAGAKAVVVDLLFSEVQMGAGRPPGQSLADDQRLSEATAEAGNVYHALQLVRSEPTIEADTNADLPAGAAAGTGGAAPLTEDFKRRFGMRLSGERGPEYTEAYPPFADLYSGARGIGVVTFNADDDGVFRQERLLFSHGESHFAALGLVAALDLLDVEALESEDRFLVLRSLDGPSRHIPLGPGHRYRINPYGHFDTYSYSGVFLSAFQLFNGQYENLPVDPTVFEDKVVFIGASAGGVGDLKSTALGARTPGVYLHAALTANVLDEDFLHFLPFWAEATVALLLLALTVVAVFRRRTYLEKVGQPFLCAIGYATLAYLLAGRSLMLDLWSPLLIMGTGFLVAMTVLSFSDGRERQRFRRILGQYVSPVVLTSVMSEGRDGRLKAEVGSQEHLTLFFSDLRGFTAITERYPVEIVVQALNAYLSRMVTIIFDQGGTLDKFIGDAIMAFWGAPLKDERQHHRAVGAALNMQAAMAGLNREGRSHGYPELRMGIGIHSGDVILGNIGSTKKLDYTVIGDSVNFTARLESLTKFYQAGVLISEATHRHVAAEFCCRTVDRVCVQGKTEPIQIYEVLDFADTKNEDMRQLAELSTEGFRLYKARDFEKALERYGMVRALFPDDTIGRIFTERCQQYLDSPPPLTWRGEFICQNK